MNYLNNKLLEREIIISKGKGKPTTEYIKYITLIIDGIYYKLNKSYSVEYREDIKQEMYIKLHLLFKKYDYKRYDNALAYFTEVCKRQATDTFNTEIYKTKNYLLSKNKFISLSDVYTL